MMRNYIVTIQIPPSVSYTETIATVANLFGDNEQREQVIGLCMWALVPMPLRLEPVLPGESYMISVSFTDSETSEVLTSYYNSTTLQHIAAAPYN